MTSTKAFLAGLLVGAVIAVVALMSTGIMQGAVVLQAAPVRQAAAPVPVHKGNMARAESFGFFDELDSRWMLRKFIHLHQAALEKDCTVPCSIPGFLPCEGRKWWQLHHEPSLSCPFERRIGPYGQHGQWVCNPHRIDEMAVESGKGCLVYSFRDSDRFLFERAVHHEISSHCEIHVFSNKPWQSYSGFKEPPSYVHYHVRQLGSQPPAVSLDAMVKELGHVGRIIDILNIACEGCEWHQYAGWIHPDVFVRQILLRMSWPADNPSHPTDHKAIEEKRRAFLQFPEVAPPEIPGLHNLFVSSGYVVTHKEFDTANCLGNCVHMSFLKLDKSFQSLDSLQPNSTFYELKLRQTPARTCWEKHPGLGPLVDPMELQKLMESMFLGWDLKGSGTGLALKESLGYIDEPDADWLRRKLIHKEMLEGESKKRGKSQEFNPYEFWQYHYEPNFNCDFIRRLGQYGDGGKWICDPHRLTQRASSGQGCLVYSIGSVGDASFETATYESISPLCEIHTFDLNPWSSYTSAPLPKFVNYHTQRIGREPPSKTIPQIVEELGHKGRTIDLFKIDCEGCEWETFQGWFGAGVSIRMILIEVHYPSKQEQVLDFFEMIQSYGYAIYRKEPNTLGGMGGYQEYGFIKLDSSF